MTSLKLRAGARSTTIASVIAISAIMGGGLAYADSAVSAADTSPAATAPAPTTPKYGCAEAQKAAEAAQQAAKSKAAADQAVQHATTPQQYQAALDQQKAAQAALDTANQAAADAASCSELPSHGTPIPGGTFPVHPTSGTPGGVDSASVGPNTPSGTTPGGGSGVNGVSTGPGSGVAGVSTSPACAETSTSPGGSETGTGAHGGSTSTSTGSGCAEKPCTEASPSHSGTGATGSSGSGTAGAAGTGAAASGSGCNASETSGAEVVTGRNPADDLVSASSQMLRWAVGIAGLLLIALGAVTVVARRKALLADGGLSGAKIGAMVAAVREEISRRIGQRG